MTYRKAFMGPDGRPVQVTIRGLDADGNLVGDEVRTEGIVSFTVDQERPFDDPTTVIRGEVLARRDEQQDDEEQEPAPLP